MILEIDFSVTASYDGEYNDYSTGAIPEREGWQVATTTTTLAFLGRTGFFRRPGEDLEPEYICRLWSSTVMHFT